MKCTIRPVCFYFTNQPSSQIPLVSNLSFYGFLGHRKASQQQAVEAQEREGVAVLLMLKRDALGKQGKRENFAPKGTQLGVVLLAYGNNLFHPLCKIEAVPQIGDDGLPILFVLLRC